MFFFQGVIIAILVAIAWQDFKERAVYAFFFPILIALLVFRAIFLDSFSLASCIINLGIIALQTSLLYLYLFLKEKVLPALENYIGLGDILFFIVLAFVFPPATFLLFQLGSFLITLIFVFLFKEQKNIPLAGCQAILLIVAMLLYQFVGASIHDSDNLLFYHLSGLYGY